MTRSPSTGSSSGKIERERSESGVGENERALTFSLLGDGVERPGSEGGVRYGDTLCVRDKRPAGEFSPGIFAGVERGRSYSVSSSSMFNAANSSKAFTSKYSCMSCSPSFVKSHVLGNSFLRGSHPGVDSKMSNTRSSSASSQLLDACSVASQ